MNGAPSTTRTPLVSVMISTCNRAGYLWEAAQSVLEQTLTDLELIVCDDASTDETPAVCRELEQRDARVRSLRHPVNLGMVGNWNSGLTAAQGRYFAKLDDDNRYLPTFLERLVAPMEATWRASFAFADEWFIDGSGKRDRELTEFSSRKYRRAGLAGGLHRDTPLLAVQQSPGINAAVFRRAPIVALGGFRKVAGASADYDLFLHLASKGHLAYYVPDRLSEYRWHPAMSSADLLMSPVKARESVATLEAYRFHGRAERLRRRKLSLAYHSLGRIQLLSGDLLAARRALWRANRILPGSPRRMLMLACLYMPAAALDRGVGWRYRDRTAA
jgi:glycosyltransferase involved in cell wall biosynthesis